MSNQQLSPELREALSCLRAIEARDSRPDEAFHFGELAKAYALVSIAQSLEKLTAIAEQEEERKRSTPEGFGR